MRSWLEVITISQGKKSINLLNSDFRISNVNLEVKNPKYPKYQMAKEIFNPETSRPVDSRVLLAAFASPRFENPRKLCHFSIFPFFSKTNLPHIQDANCSAFAHGHAGLDRLKVQPQRGSRSPPAATALPAHSTRPPQARTRDARPGRFLCEE